MYVCLSVCLLVNNVCCLIIAEIKQKIYTKNLVFCLQKLKIQNKEKNR